MGRAGRASGISQSSARVPPPESGVAANRAPLPAGTLLKMSSLKAFSAGPPSESPEFGEVPLGMALPYVNGQVGDPLSVPAVLA